MEKRGELRRTESASIVFSPFSIKNWNARSSKVGNFSNNGLYFMANRALQAGATIYIRAESSSTSKRGMIQDSFERLPWRKSCGASQLRKTPSVSDLVLE